MYLGNLVKIDITEDPTDLKIVYLGDVLDYVEREKATTILKRCAKIFSFGYHDILRMDPNIVVHSIITC